MDIVNRRLAEIHPYENNPRFNDEAVDAVAASIQQFGFKVPFVLDEDGVIVAGHTRHKACNRLVEKYGFLVPKIDGNGNLTDETIDLSQVPCVVADDLTPEQIKAFRLADNKVAELAYWNEEALAKELEEIADIDMSVFGFGEEESPLGDELEDDTYTAAVNVPQYEITGKKPTIAEMLDTEKADTLIAKIKASSVSEEEKAFLIRAAHRHNVFNYGNVAEYYAHASPEMQELMEASALVIIDVGNAIANGYATLMGEVLDAMEGDGDNA